VREHQASSLDLNQRKVERDLAYAAEQRSNSLRRPGNDAVKVGFYALRPIFVSVQHTVRHVGPIEGGKNSKNSARRVESQESLLQTLQHRNSSLCEFSKEPSRPPQANLLPQRLMKIAADGLDMLSDAGLEFYQT
jgi:hypothetical protein